MELEKCSNDLLSSNEIAKNKKKTVNTNGKNLDKNSFKVIFDKEVLRGKVSSNKESNIQTYMTGREEEPEDPITSAVSKLANGFGVSNDFMLAILASLKIDPKDLLDPTKEAWIRKKLEYYFGIGEKKKQLVDQLTKMISHK